ncbi:MAG: SMC family ATPase [Methanobacteriota archaeon]
MIVRAISLRNYRRFRRLDLELPEGVIAIVGPNGSGKTTLVEAVAWALFGNESEITRGDKKSIIHQGSGKGEKCEATVEFEIDSRLYLVRRQMSASGAATASLETAGKSLAEGALPVTAHVAKLLGMDYQAFFASIFARQKELNALSKQTQGERRATVMRLLGVVALDQATASARKDLSLAKENVTFQQRQLADSGTGKPAIDIWRGEAERCSSELTSWKAEIEKGAEGLVAARESVLRAEARLTKSKERKAKHDKLREIHIAIQKDADEASRNVKRIEAELADIAREEEMLASLGPRELRFSEAREEFEELAKLEIAHAERAGLSERLEALKADLEGKSASLKGLAKELKKLEALEKEAGELDNKLAKLSEERAALIGKTASEGEKLRALEKSLSELEKRKCDISSLGAEGKCPTCERPLGTHHKALMGKTGAELEAKEREAKGAIQMLESLGEESASLEAQMLALERRKATLGKSLDSLKRKTGEAKALESEVAALARSADAAGKKLAKLDKIPFDEKGFATLKAELRKLEKAHEKYVSLSKAAEARPKKESALEAAKASMEKASAGLSSLAKEQLSLDFDPAVHSSIEAEERKSRDEAHRLAIGLEKARGDMAVAMEKLGRAKAEISRLEGVEREIAELDRRREYLSRTVELLDSFKRHVVARIRPVLTATTSELLDKLSSGRYSQVEIDEDYGIRVLDDGQAFGLERFSGGEEDMVNLCLRLAISQLIAERGGAGGLNMVVLDEIFGSQDPGRRRSILLALNGLSGIFRQILLITHIEDMRESVSAVVQVGVGEGGASKAELA